MGQYLLEFVFDKLRRQSLQVITKSYVLHYDCLTSFRILPSVPVAWITKELAFPSEADCLSYLVSHGLLLNQDKSEVDSKSSLAGLLAWERSEDEKHKLEGQ